MPHFKFTPKPVNKEGGFASKFFVINKEKQDVTTITAKRSIEYNPNACTRKKV